MDLRIVIKRIELRIVLDTLEGFTDSNGKVQTDAWPLVFVIPDSFF